MQLTETLRCEVGDHDWQRERKRGKKPLNCPEHAAEVKAEILRARRAEALEKAREAKRIAREARMAEEVRDLYPLLNSEEVRVIDYIDAQLASGRREPADESLLTKRRSDVLKAVSKRAGTTYVPTEEYEDDQDDD